MREHWANPSSLYGPGARSEEALNAARAAVARTLGCKAKELYFTSCGSESNNLALLGAARTRTFGKDIVVSGFEHPSVQRPLVDIVPIRPRPPPIVDENGIVIDENSDGYYPQTTIRQRPVGLRLEQTLANGSTPSQTVFGLRRSYNCFWISL